MFDNLNRCNLKVSLLTNWNCGTEKFRNKLLVPGLHIAVMAKPCKLCSFSEKAWKNYNAMRLTLCVKILVQCLFQ